MRMIRIAALLAVVFLPLVVTSSASALDLCEEPHCQPPDAEQNTPYEFEFEAEEGCLPYRATFLNGNLPQGLRVTTEAKLVGTPLEAGDFEFWVGLDDSLDCKSPQSQAHYFIHVMPDLAVTTESLPLGVPGTPYGAQLKFSNPEVGWSVIWDITQGALPQGLSLSENGIIAGIPAAPGVTQFVIRAREPFRRSGERQLTLTVATALQANSAIGPGEVGLRYSGAIRATGGLAPLTWSVATGTLPNGLSLNTTTGAITGIPTGAGSFTLEFAVTDAAGQRVTVPTSIGIAARLAIATVRLPQATTRKPYRVRLQSSGGVAPKQWRIVRGTLPRGLKLDRTTGVLSGVARAAGAFQVTIQVTDRLGGRSTRTMRLSVKS